MTEQFFECEPKLVKQLALKVKDPFAREDLLHEVYIKFAARIESINHRDNLCGYLFRITENIIIDYFRRERKFVLTADENVFEKLSAPPVTDGIDDKIRLADCCLQSFISRLPPKYSEALILTELEDQSQKVTAKALGISYSGLKSRVQRAREMLKKSILDCCDYQFDKYANIVGCGDGVKNGIQNGKQNDEEK